MEIVTFKGITATVSPVPRKPSTDIQLSVKMRTVSPRAHEYSDLFWKMCTNSSVHFTSKLKS